MANLKNVIYLSNEDYETLVSTGTVTIDGDTLTYDENNVYVTPDKLASSTEDGLMSSADKIKLDGLDKVIDLGTLTYDSTLGAYKVTGTLTAEQLSFVNNVNDVVFTATVGSGLLFFTHQANNYDGNSEKDYFYNFLTVQTTSGSTYIQGSYGGVEVNPSTGDFTCMVKPVQKEIITSHQSIKSLDTTATTAQSTSSSEAIAGSGTITLHKVAKTGTYSDLIGTPTIPTVNNGTLSIQGNGTTASTFTANQSGNTTLNIKGSGATTVTKSADNEITVSSTNSDHYPTTFTWTNGTTAGPTGSLTGNSGFTAVSFGAIPTASTTQSGIVTNTSQDFGGEKTFKYLVADRRDSGQSPLTIVHNIENTDGGFLTIKDAEYEGDTVYGQIVCRMEEYDTVEDSSMDLIFRRLEDGEEHYVAYISDIPNTMTQAQFDEATPGVAPSQVFSIVDVIYPVGSVYMSVSQIEATKTTTGKMGCPIAELGGTWVRIEGQFLLSATNGATVVTNDKTGNASVGAGSTGGEGTHIITADEGPYHSHFLRIRDVNGGGSTQGPSSTVQASISWSNYCDDGGSYTGSSGQNLPHNNMPPYLAVYMWKRTA